MIKFMLEYIKENPSKAAQDVVFVIGLLAMTSMLLLQLKSMIRKEVLLL